MILISLVLLSKGLSIANPFNVSGTVTSAYDLKFVRGVIITVKGTNTQTVTDRSGQFSIEVHSEKDVLVFQKNGFKKLEKLVGIHRNINVVLELEDIEVELEVEEAGSIDNKVINNPAVYMRMEKQSLPNGGGNYYTQENYFHHNTEEYDFISENGFLKPLNEPLSTFSIDVDAASYSNLRRFLNHGQLPPADAVRIEEMVNYFSYDYQEPNDDHPFSITTEQSIAPWNPQHKLIHIGLQGQKLNYDEMKASNLVFLIDVSGSMQAENKLPLLKSSLKILLSNLGDEDRVAIVTYAGAAGLVLPSTPAYDREKIIAALDRLEAGGSTAGGAGIKLAYKVAMENFIEDGNNRVILATDGDFNVGVSSTSEMVRMIEEKRKLGIYLTITGFGMGNYKDGRMEQISNAGNGNYFYIDTIKEAMKVFQTEMRATLFTIAKDVKIQVEFNPDKVQAYRLIGYENRMLEAQDFNDDLKDAGELGAGHTVTALYEIIPVGIESGFIKDVDDLKYQQNKNNKLSKSEELLTVKFRYKRPKEEKSRLITHILLDETNQFDQTTNNFRWSAAVAEFGMLLRNSEYKSKASYEEVLALSEGAKGKDEEGYREEFIQMVKSIMPLAKR